VTAKDISQFAIYAALLKEGDLDRISTDVESALTEDAGFNGTSESLQRSLGEPLKSYSAACQEFITWLNGITTNAGPVEALQFFNAGQKAHRAAYKLWRTAAMELDTLLEKRIAAKRQALSYTLGGTGAGLIFSFILSFFVSRGITRPLASLTATTTRILEGDNSARAPVQSRDELGQLAGSFNQMVEARVNAQAQVEDENRRLQGNIQDLLLVVSDASDGRLGVRAKVSEGALGNVCDALNLMLENVGEFISNAKAASDRVATAAADITTVAQELENGEQRQSKEINATSEGVKALNGQAQRVLKNCQSATQAADNARRTAEQGAKVVREVVQGMEKIRENTQANAKKIKRLGDRSMEIAGIVKVIGDISAKTDMLALNASIEAARAGEQGRGFTVVAEQVRNLADRTKTLTNQIEKLVNDIQQETAEAVAQMEAQTQEVELGTRAAQSAGGTLENIVTVSAQSSELVAQINQAATTQASRTQEMLVTVDAINQVVAEAQVRVRETRSTSEQLAGLSAELNKRLAQFEVGRAPETVSA
jgi:twitching motility protein PilJ